MAEKISEEIEFINCPLKILLERRNIRQKLGVIGDGLEIKTSTLKNAGNGLFATREYKKNEFITIYEGTYVKWEDAIKKTVGEKSYIRTLWLFKFVIDGSKMLTNEGEVKINNPQKQLLGWGGGAFVNDARDNKKYNSEFDSIFFTKHIIADEEELKPCYKFIVLLAIKKIRPGDEIFVSYGKHYWEDYDKKKKKKEEEAKKKKRKFENLFKF